ncbi:hypothetical protein F7734_18560 [Scytonema sp. UIC 10036]|uniref:hypothetical protein n=1 Tax=Scytonema sp. UIC 10036 TaxID=2304196 RepID=UPI0012DA2CBF|nr:hypothetical protein [Scytonema sp. UIC 10036]MUG94275.1 hypothetical protein [Scytonema sp. UIC 10036]
MNSRLFISLQEKEKLYHAELVRYGVDLRIAAKAAKILAFGNSNELLSFEEKKLVTDACKLWVENRNRRLTK